jgi:hypothetical protein
MNIPSRPPIEPDLNKAMDAISNLNFRNANDELLIELQVIRATIWAAVQTYFSEEQKQQFNQFYQKKIAEIVQSHVEQNEA